MLAARVRSLLSVAVLATALFGLASPAALAARKAPPLPPPTGTVVNVSTVSALMSAISGATPGTTIMVADGFYDLGVYGHSVSFNADNVTLRGASGNRDAVIIKGQGMSVSSGSTPTIFHVFSDDVMIADLTLRDAYYHLIQVHGENIADRFHIYNCRLIDSGEQFIKVSVNAAAQPKKCENGIVEYCQFEFTTTSRWWYTHGVDILNAKDWIIRDCVFRNIRGPAGVLTGGAILAWQKSEGTIVERCEFYECDFGVNFGNGGGSVGDHTGGIIRNNFIYRKGNFGDVAITCVFASNFQIYNNTCILNGTFPWVIDYRFPSSTGTIAYNITDGNILARDGATATLTGNLTNAQPSWFVDHANGNLHLASTASACINQAASLAAVTDDVDGDPRPMGTTPDTGADEFTWPGDITRDGKVNVFDLQRMGASWNKQQGQPGYNPACDLTGDNKVNVFDLQVMASNWNKSV
mgnify:CR=1 FL=1